MPDPQTSVLIGMAEQPQYLLLDRANRHGVIAGATGTGKTVTLQILAQGLSDAGVPVFCADVKGDLSGIAMPGAPSEKLLERARLMNLDMKPASPPVMFWDLFGQKGHPIRATISEMGPTLTARLLELNDVQEGVLTITFHVADAEGLLLLDLKDLQAALHYVADNAQEIGRQYGNVAPATIGTIQRKLLALDSEGGGHFFSEPALKLADLMRTDSDGKGYVSVLAADTLIQSPRLYSTFLLWLISELFEELPEVGDPDKPRLVFFFDEAHLLFTDAPHSLLQKVEQVVRLIRSKGVGIYFVTQNPADIPDTVLAQLGNRVQHALRAYTPSEQRGLKAASDSFRPNPAFDTAEAIQALGVGEALVSVLDEKGVPSMVAKTMIRPPVSRLGPITDQERAQIMEYSPVKGLYDQELDRESAFETLRTRAERVQAEAQAHQRVDAAESQAHRDYGMRPAPRPASRPSNRESMAESLAKSVIRAAGSQMGRSITRELLRGILGGMSRR